MKRVRWAAAAVGATVLALGLSACSSANPGQAAVVGDTKIAESTVGDQMRSVNEALGRPAEEPGPDLARTIVSANIGYSLIEQTADKLQVAVSEGQLDQVYGQQVSQVGGEEQLRQAAAQAGIAPENLQRDLRAQLLAAAIANKVAPGVDQQAQQTAFVAAVKDVARSIDVEVSPAYGVWDPENLQLIEDPDAVSRPEKPTSVLPGQ
ncbi:MAG: SurA N-terminal domain-containing protein [Candidatus Nanopelagicales bacterium]